MNEPLDPLEAELKALRPLEVSSAMRGRVGESLADSPSLRVAKRWRQVRRLVLAGALAAACLMTVVVVVRWGGGRGVEPPPIVVQPQSQPQPSPLVHVEVAVLVPPLLTYQRALACSCEVLDAAIPPFAWPLQAASTLKVSAAIPADLLD